MYIKTKIIQECPGFAAEGTCLILEKGELKPSFVCRISNLPCYRECWWPLLEYILLFSTFCCVVNRKVSNLFQCQFVREKFVKFLSVLPVSVNYKRKSTALVLEIVSLCITSQSSERASWKTKLFSRTTVTLVN